MENLEISVELRSYLFNLESEFGFLPDLDVVYLRNGQKTNKAMDIIKKFYESYEWKTYTLKQDLPSMDKKITQGILIHEPSKLRKIAKEKLNYSFK